MSAMDARETPETTREPTPEDHVGFGEEVVAEGHRDRQLTYGSYLRLDQLLDAQHLESDPPAHDELLFITIHQVYELWFQQLLHEVEAVRDALASGDDRVWWARHLMDRVHVIERLRTADGIPMAVERSHIPDAVAPGLGDEPLAGRSLYDVLASTYGVLLDRGEQTIEAGIADPTDAALLDLPAGAAAVLLLQRRSFVGDRPVEFAVSTYRADRYQLHVALEVPRAR